MTDNRVPTTLPRDIRARSVDPFRWLRSEMDRIFEDFDSPRRFFGAQFPPLDMHEEKDRYVLTVDVAGYDKEQIDISTEDGSLVLKGRRSEQSERQEGGYLINERQQGEFERHVAMPRRIDPNQIRAIMDKGQLRIEVPKVPDPQARRIEIQSEASEPSRMA
ncbi:Hsp20/alpha crystallin family protein [Sphingomonas sp. GCM10030256]|uniref:Hsp20/alpha crystallin family protein n=1 Tax=Sphingomonas sp. GCM10030256 TaxID=3273427 RepID=UPI00360832C5